MCQSPEEQITAAAAKAKTVLSQLGPLVWALHANQGAVIPTALCVDLEPDVWVAIGTDELPEQRAKRKDAVVEVLRDLKRMRADEHPELFTSSGYRDAINRSIVTYAVAVLEQFLDRAGKPVFLAKGGEEKDWRDSFGSRCEALCQVGVPLYCCAHYAESAFLALMRHKIVHVDARVDRRLVDQVAALGKQAGRGIHFRLSDDGSSVVWVQCGGQKLCTCSIGKRLSLAIDEVVLPLLGRAQAFVAEAGQKLCEAAGNCPKRVTI